MADNKEKNILAIDSSGKNLIVGLSFGEDRLVKSKEPVEKSHSQLLINKIDKLLQSAGVSKDELDAIAVVTGPGSFTGLRIGIAAAKGIATALDIPVIGINIFEIAAHMLRNMKEKVFIVIPHKKDEFFVTQVCCGEFSLNDVKIIPCHCLSDVVNDCLVAGFGINLKEQFPEISEKVISNQLSYDASELILMGSKKLTAGENS
ncbi:MAG: tRNA (adenosine(37)-N6)-threonylcarbamoyltransferase complex dimerization subunit type 1 TsaB, partial [Candidatus Zixiibacteriota bacterium]